MNEFVKRLAKLPADRRAELLALLRDGASESQVPAAPTPRHHGATIPLSYGQESIWFVTRFEPDQPTYNTSIAVRLRGSFDASAWQRAFAQVVSSHDMLRTAVVDGPDGPMQTTYPFVEVELPLVDLRGGDEATVARAADDFIAEFGRRLFALEKAPLWRAAVLRLAPDVHIFAFVVHHVVFDGWSWGIVFAELADRYRIELGAGSSVPKARTATDGAVEPVTRLEFGDFVLWERDWLADGNLDRLTAYWQGALAGAAAVELPGDRLRPAVQSYRGASRYRSLAMGRDAVARLARSLRTTPNVVYLSVFLTLLHRYTGAEDLVVGAPTANRDSTEVESVVGYFINMLAVRADASGDPSFRDFVGRVHRAAQDAFAHGSLPFSKVVEALRPDRDPSRSPIFQLVFAFQNAERDFSLPGLSVHRLPVDAGSSRYDMSWELVEGPEQPELAVRYSTDLYSGSSVDELMVRYEAILAAVMVDPDLGLSRIPLLDAAERDQLARRWNGPTRAVPATTVPEMFAEQARRDPDAVALVCAGEVLTYRDLDERANRLAHHLHALGTAPGRLVALCLPRRADLIVAMLATMKAGGAYLPLDPSHPEARLATILADSDPVAIVTTAATSGSLPRGGVPQIDIDAQRDVLARLDAAAPALTARPSDLAYVLYTSGSTGVPKGVLIEHHSVINFVLAMRDQFEITPADCLLAYAAATFDVSVFEIFSALLTGARVQLATDPERLDVDRLPERLADWGVTITDLPPTIMALLDPERLPALRSVFVGLESYPGELVNRWNKGKRFFNGYGPTECTVTMIVHECAGHWDSSPPIGLPIVNHVAHVVDTAGNLVPPGVPGELVIGGVGLARGYLNRPELTAEKFYPDPFGTSPGGQLYRTGDLVRRRSDGVLVFLGRVDHQIKLRGLRIELGEIESVLSRRGDIDQVAVDVRLDGQGEKHLVCYLAGPTAPPPAAQLRTYLAERLPAYMVPTQFVTLPSLPLNSSGKVVRTQLPDPAFEVVPLGPVEFASDLERSVATGIVAPLLGLAPDQVEPERNFFELGGHSLAAARVLARVRSEYDAEVGLADFFLAPTVRGLTELIQRRRAARGAEDALMAMLESMTDEEAAALLAAEPDDAQG